MYQASLAMRISVSFSRLLLNWVATYRHNIRVIIPNSSSVRYIWLKDDTVRLPMTEKKKVLGLFLLIYNLCIVQNADHTCSAWTYLLCYVLLICAL